MRIVLTIAAIIFPKIVDGAELSKEDLELKKLITREFAERINQVERMAKENDQGKLDSIEAERFFGRPLSDNAIRSQLKIGMTRLNRWQWFGPAERSFLKADRGTVMAFDRPQVKFVHKGSGYVWVRIQSYVMKNGYSTLGIEFAGSRVPPLKQPFVLHSFRRFDERYEVRGFTYRAGQKIPKLELLSSVVKRLRLGKQRPPTKPTDGE